MRAMKTKTLTGRLLRIGAVASASLLAAAAQAAAPGITGTSFDLRAEPAYITQPDGQSIYSWGYGCNTTTSIGYAPSAIGASKGAACPTMQIPGPTLIVHQGDTVTVTLTNNLPAAAGNTSILFPGFAVTATNGTPGVLTTEAPNASCNPSMTAGCNTVTYTFTATTEGTHSYYSGTQGDLQIEMGLYGALIVLPASVPANCTASAGSGTGTLNDQAKAANGESDFRLAASAYSHAATCYDREYLFQFSEMDPKIHTAAEAIAKCTGTGCPASMNTVETEPYHPAYYLINGRSMPDDMDPEYAVQYPHQPYNGNPHMHPGEMTLLRIIGQGRWQHPFHEHANHVRIIARDGNLLLAKNAPTKIAGPLLYTTTTTPGLAMDGLFYWSGKGLNWDVFGHTADTTVAGAQAPCVADAYGYYTLKSDGTSAAAEPNYYEWCGDHNKALEVHAFGAVGSGGPVTLPDPGLFVNGAWYSGTPYFGPDAAVRSVGSTPKPPSGTVANNSNTEAGYAYMWHSHNEREITTDNIFPGGMLMMMLVDPRAFVIDESN